MRLIVEVRFEFAFVVVRRDLFVFRHGWNLPAFCGLDCRKASDSESLAELLRFLYFCPKIKV
jgi:hypothetical protein